MLTTGVSGSKRYHAYGGSRGGGVASEWQYTGQELDSGTGLVYMHARYYDPATGQFLSPDTLVPEPGNVLSYNRYMYGYDNPVKYSDPSGRANCVNSDGSTNWDCRWFTARGYDLVNGTWTAGFTASFMDDGALLELLSDSGIGLYQGAISQWGADEIRLMGEGVAALAQKAGWTAGNICAQGSVAK